MRPGHASSCSSPARARESLVELPVGVRSLNAPRLASTAVRAVLVETAVKACTAGAPSDLAALAGRFSEATGCGALRPGGFEADTAAAVALPASAQQPTRMSAPFTYREAAPRSAAVEAIWSLRVHPGAARAHPYLVLPDGCLDVIVRKRRDGLGRVLEATVVVTGPAERAHSVMIGPGDEFAGLRFQPGRGGASLGLDPAAIAGLAVEARAVSPALRDLADELVGAADMDGAERCLGRAAERWSGGHGADPRALEAVRLLRASGGRLSIGETARLVGVSPRTLRREVGAAAGLGPKALARVFRFRRALRLARRGGASDLAAVAHGCGYADQAHMAREFRELAGFAPSRPPDNLKA